MAEKSRIKNLSTRFLSAYKYGIVVLVGGLFCLMMYLSWHDGWFGLIYHLLFYGWFGYLWLKLNAKIYHTEFDDEFLYVKYRNSEVLIPLENIKDIELKSAGGVWRVDLAYADLPGDHFYFKPSLLYPLNYKRKDALVNLLWNKIEKARTKVNVIQPNTLRS